MHAVPSRKCILMVAAGLFIATSVQAEAPMHVDDAGTLGQGGMKVEGNWGKDDKTRGGELLFGFAPIEDLEVGLSLARTTDRSEDPSTRLNGTGISFKWVPIKSETGWSLGASFGYGHTHVEDRVTPETFTENGYALTGLASYRLANGQVLHLNLGAERIKAQGVRDTVGTWGIGYEFPLVEHLQLTIETFGAEKSRPDKAIGLRYEVVEGFKLSGAAGRGSDHSFGQVGFSWEF